MRKITPFLWFDDQAEEAMHFYVSIFKNSRVLGVTRVGGGDPGEEGAVTMANFELDGQKFYALNGGPAFKFTEAISFYVNCETQEEVDELWARLSEGGEPSQCGWLKDRYGLSWQIVPAALGEMMQGDDPGRSKRVMDALLQMGKIDIATLQRAYEGP